MHIAHDRNCAWKKSGVLLSFAKKWDHPHLKTNFSQDIHQKRWWTTSLKDRVASRSTCILLCFVSRQLPIVGLHRKDKIFSSYFIKFKTTLVLKGLFYIQCIKFYFIFPDIALFRVSLSWLQAGFNTCK